jgi:hypothetical protein
VCLTAEFEMGSGSGHTAQTTRPAQDKTFGKQVVFVVTCCVVSGARGYSGGRSRQRTWITRAIKFNRAISTGKLNASPRLHTQPINVVVFHGSQGSTRFEVGFPLRCLQRLSRPYVATLHCGWRHNSSTRGMFIPVLSY